MMGGIMSIVLILYLGGEAIEYSHHENIADCLGKKRKIERFGWKDTRNTRYACEQREVELEVGIDGNPQVVRLLD
tara:strand:+ start:221 stop:445 length:225 start_codon:yes stop_codon:yes gene_type:complete